MIKFKKNLKGMVLITVVCLMSMLILIVTCSLAIVTSLNKKSIKHYGDNQVYSIAKSNLDAFISCLENNELESFRPIREKISQMQNGDKLTVNVSLAVGSDMVSDKDDKIVIIKDDQGTTHMEAIGHFDDNETKVSQIISSTGSSTDKTDIIMVFDRSGSMDKDDTTNVKNASINFVNQIIQTMGGDPNDASNPAVINNPNVRIGLVAFSESSTTINMDGGNLSNNLNEVKSKIASVLGSAGNGGTNMVAGMIGANDIIRQSIQEAANNQSGSTPTTPPGTITAPEEDGLADNTFVIFFGDGEPTFYYPIAGGGTSKDDLYKFKVVNDGSGYGSDEPSRKASIAAAQNAKFLGATVFTIGFGISGKNNAEDTLKSMASEVEDPKTPGEKLYFSAAKGGTTELNEAMKEIFEKIYGSVSGAEYFIP